MYTNQIFEKIIFIFITILVFFTFNAVNIGYVPIIYDQQRLLQIIFLIINAIFFIKSGLYLKIHLSIYLFLFVFSILFIIFQKKYLLFVDLTFYFLLSLVVLNFSKNNMGAKVFDLVIYFPIFNILFLFFSLIDFFYSLEIKDWHLNYSNIRLYDSALIPIIFYMFYIFSYLKNSRKKLISILMVCYLISLFFDGARAALGAICIGLVVTSFFYRTKKEALKQLKAPFFLLFIALGFYAVYILIIHLLYDGMIKATIVRTTTSLRWEIWNYTIQEWFKNPILGNGGGSLLWLNNGNFSVLHPHNFIILWLTEYGLVGILHLILLFYIFFKVFVNRYYLHPILFAGLIAIVVDGLLSGSWIYPDTQILIALFFSVILSEILSHKDLDIYGKKI